MDLLPQELLDEIIGHIPLHDKQSLRNCSLVAKSWMYPSRRSLFEAVIVVPQAKFWSWIKCISPNNAELLQNVRTLHCLIEISPCVRTGHIFFLRNYFPSLPLLRHLFLFSGNLQSVTQIGVPLAFQHTLKYLSLRGCRTTIATLVTLINYFPNLDHLELHNLFQESGRQPTPPLSRALQKLSVSEPDTRDDLGILDQLLGLQPQFDEVVIEINSFFAPLLPQRVIDGVGASVKRLEIDTCFECMCKVLKFLHGCHKYTDSVTDLESPLTLSNCRELRELEVCLFFPEDPDPDLVSSITSTKIQKIKFTQSAAFYDCPVGDTYWKRLDNSLCRLADRLGCEHRLLVEFHVIEVEDGELDMAKYLPTFSKKGWVRVWDEQTETDIYRSDGERRT